MTRSDTPLPSRPRAKRVQFGRGGPEVSQVCFGTEHIVSCTPSFGGGLLVDAADLYDVFFIDTDMVYGSHPQVAQAIRMAGRTRFVISTKTYARTKQQARKDLDRIFYELGTDYIDIGLLHRVRPGALDEYRPPLEVLLRAKEQGLVRHVGLSSHSPEIVAAASSMPEIEIVYVTFNRDGSRLDSGSREEMQQALAEAHRNGKGTCVLKTLGRGDLVRDLKPALEWVLQFHEQIDVYCIGFSALAELGEDLALINHYFSKL